MPLKNGSDQETISENIAKLIGEGYSREEAAAIAYSHAGRATKDAGLEAIYGRPLEALSHRSTDRNGFVEVRDNPISKVGVFQYSGAQIGHPDPARHGDVFNVYRPAEELSDPECIESFKLVPFIDEHAMLGPEEMGATPAEKKGVQGVIGEQVYFDGTYLRGNLKMFAEAIKGAVSSGKKELSPGYTATYELTPGMFGDQNYDAIQRNIRGNHLALVREGRTGPDVAVLDRMTFTVDAKEFGHMADENTEGGEDLKSLLAKLKPLLVEQANMTAALAELGITATPPAAPEMDEDLPPAAPSDVPITADAEGMKKLEGTMDAILKELKGIGARVEKVEKAQGTMDTVLVAGLADRDALAGRVSNFVGTFDAKGMTAQGVAEYAVEKLGIPCAKGNERNAFDAWAHGRDIPHKARTINTTDGKAPAGDDALAKAWEKQ